MPKTKGKELSIDEKVKLIQEHERGKSFRHLGVLSGIGKSRSDGIYKNREAIRKQYESFAPNSRKRREKSTENSEINSATWNWFQKARIMDVPLSGPLLQAKDRTIASLLDNTTFKASNGWLESFRTTHGIRFGVLSGESNSVSDSE
ncbi:major centromere autoantigen B-like protein, partial [Leptotrombidium deliense]